MTSLAEQLKRLALPQTDPSLLERSEVASLLFTCKEAATIDRDTFFAIGCTGLEELMGIDPSFEEFQSSLFSSTSKGLERSVQTKAVNQQLDKNISLFLIHLSPYFMLKPAQKCLEWLIQRFHIHLYNQDSLIGCVLPYHETNLFVRVIQLLDIKSPTHKWHWMDPIRKPGVPLARGTVITHCYKDLDFMDFICRLVAKSVKVFSECPGNSAQLRVLLVFYASTIVSALGAAEKITDTMVSLLLPYVQKGLKSSVQDYRAATYMIICQMTVKVTVETSLVHSLMVQISKTLFKMPSLIRDGLACLNLLLQTQKGDKLGRKPFNYLCKTPELVTLLQGLSAGYDISPLLRYLLPHLVHTIMKSDTEEQEESEETENDIYIEHLQAILESIPLEKDLDSLLASKFLEEFISCGTEIESNSTKMAALNQKILPLIRLLERKYPKALDSVLEKYLEDCADEADQNLFHQFISLSLSCGKYKFLEVSDTSLLLSLNHPQPAVRVLALQHLKDVIETSKEGFDQAFIEEAIFGRLKDDNRDVVMSALSSLEIFREQVNPEVIVSSLLNIFQKADLSKEGKWYKVLEQAVKILVKEEILKEKKELLDAAVMQLLPFMIITNANSKSADWKMAVCLSQSDLCSLHPLLKGWPEALEEAIQSTESAELVGVANEKMILLLSRNFPSGNPSLLLQVVDDLILVAETESDSVRQKVTTHIIAAVLVQYCCGTQVKGNYFPVCIRVFHFLDKRIKNLRTCESAEETPLSWSVETGEDTVMPEDLLSAYIEKLNSDETAHAEESAIVLFLLKNFINGLKPSMSFPKGESWWNPESLYQNSQGYLHLLLGLFDLLVSGASEGSNALQYRALMNLFFKVHLKDSEILFKFLSILWTYSYNLSNQLNYEVSAMLQTQALYIGYALLESQTSQKKKQLLLPSSPVVMSLLVNLGSPVSEVRRAALNCLHSLRGIKESLFHPLLQHLEQKTEEIVSDPTYIAQIMGTLFDELETQSKQKSQKKKLLEALENILDCVQSPIFPSYIARNLMKILHEIHGEMVLSHLLPVLNRLLEKVFKKAEAMLKDEVILLHLILGKFNEHSATLLCKNQQSLDLFIKSLHATQKIYEEIPPFQITALGQITKPFFAAVSDGMVQQKLLKVLFDLLLNCKNPLCAQTISSVFKGITVCAEQIVKELEPPENTKSLATVQQTRRQNMQQQRRPQNAELAAETRHLGWQRVMLILELLQHKKKLRHPQMLVPALFNLLSRCLEPAVSKGENMEYTKQLILSCLLNICQKLSSDGNKVPADILDKEKFNVELIVRCIRISKMPQTHHHALLLLGAAAGIFPDKVLHNIMPIFTFMGAHVLRLDDTYTFQVINKTVQMVIPALIQAEDSDLSESSGSVEEVVIKIIRVFVDALPHVPEHRRLPILSQLITTVGGDKFLWVLLVLLFEQYVTKTVTATPNTDKDAVLESDTEFWISICCEFSVRSQFQSVMKIIQYLTELPENKEDDPGTKKLMCKTKPKNQDGQLFNVESHSDKQLRHFKFLSVSFMSQLLSSQSFVKKIVEYGEPEELQELEQRLLEEVLHYINTVASSVEGNVDKPTAKFWRVLLSKCYDMLDKVNALLPTETFIPVIGGLMSNQLPSVRRKAMDLLNNKVQQRTKWQKSQILQLLELVPELIAIVKCRRKEEEEEQAINRQTALFSLKLLCKGFGTENPAPFVPVLKTAIDLISSEKEEKNVMGSALLCIAEVTCTLKAQAIPHLPRLMPALLKTLKSKKELVSNEIYLLSAITALLKVAETLPHFLSPYLLECLLQVVRLEKIVAEFGPTSQISIRVAALKTILATRLAPRILLPAVTKCYSEVLHTRKNCLGPLMNILKEHIAGMEKEHLISHQTELTAFFMKVLDFRTEHAEDDLEEVGKIEAYIIDCLISMVMKLSETSFRPLFFKLFDWSKTEATLRDRLLTFHRIADCIADKLKGLFTLFAGHLVKPFAETLNQVNISKTDEAFFDSDNNTEKSCLLLQFTMDCLHKLFLFDTQKFLSKERAETLMQPLVDQLENVLGGDEKFQDRVTAHLIPCIAQFSVAMADDSLWKPLNYQILLKTRHSSPKVRFAALLALIEVAQKLKENYLVLLPESIPFLAELMEDECEEVEQQCQKTIQQLEVILGEPLQSYF
ncbi:HEAT repeat-containing protein 1 isoform X1 [Pyrgilauda ruficollis]|uniref:HEAT repeat-containing protein 1 isoform X1 n=1 Tax=Pyrgilauda ruficollis TaxID=221976 RepID=UPI001B869E9F|nr:HEAT repeat-containing protein 1 isoform X1 [Pyrgilauda ruficollis]XP_041341385.1 HEAT repeat-containing protein 1 isoform X1 [Pyrgilauda ruficollis]